MTNKLYVGNLAYSVSNSDLEELFSQAGKVQSVAVIMTSFRAVERLRLRRDGERGRRGQGDPAIQ